MSNFGDSLAVLKTVSSFLRGDLGTKGSERLCFVGMLLLRMESQSLSSMGQLRRAPQVKGSQGGGLHFLLTLFGIDTPFRACEGAADRLLLHSLISLSL